MTIVLLAVAFVLALGIYRAITFKPYAHAYIYDEFEGLGYSLVADNA